MLYRLGYTNCGDDALFGLATVGNKVYLKYSPLDSSWCNPGIICTKLKDTDDDIKITIGDKKLKLAYHEAEELFLLLKYYHEDSPLAVCKTVVTKFKEEV